MTEPISVLLVDDHAVVRQGLRAFLDVQDDIEVVGEAADGDEAVRAVEQLVPDVVLMDLVMPGRNGVAALRELRARSPSTRVLVLTSFADGDKIVAAVKAGAAGYLLKDVHPQELAEAIRRVHGGEVSLHPSVVARLMQEVASSDARAGAPDALTAREIEVLQQLARGRSNREIGLELGIAEKTVKTHVSNILQKLQLADRTQAALYAVREQLADPE